MPHRGTHARRRTLAALIALTLAPVAVAHLPEQWLPATLDQRDSGKGVHVFRDSAGGHWLRIDDLRQLGVPIVAARADDRYVPARAVPGLVRIDEVSERIHFTTAAQPVRTHRRTHPVGSSAPEQQSPMVFEPVPATRPPTPGYLSPPPRLQDQHSRVDQPPVPMAPTPLASPAPAPPTSRLPEAQSPAASVAEPLPPMEIRPPAPPNAGARAPLAVAQSPQDDGGAARATPAQQPRPTVRYAAPALPEPLRLPSPPAPGLPAPAGAPSPTRPASRTASRLETDPRTTASVPTRAPAATALTDLSRASPERLQVIRNHVDAGQGALLVTDDKGQAWIRTLDLRTLGMRLPDALPALHAGETYVPLDALGVPTDIDRTGGRLHLNDGSPPAPPEGTLIVDLVVNQQALAEPQVLEWRRGEPWLAPETLSAAGLVAPLGIADADGWVPVSAIAGGRYVLDTTGLLLDFTAPPERFAIHHLDGRHHTERSQPAVLFGSPAFLLGYDASAGRAADGSSRASALVDAGVSFGRTSCSSRHLWRNDLHVTRLDSVCVTDWPERRLSLVLGDTASRDWGQSGAVSYGGIRLGTDFALQPYLLTQPLLGLSGTARLPSMLEVWTEQQLALRTEIDPGQFVIDGLPTLSGRGDISAVVTDALGRQTRIVSPFYSDPALMAAGLQDWALEAGRLRTGMGTPDNQYGDRFAQAGLRRGMTDWWTTSMHAAVLDDLRVGGWGNHVRLGLLGVAELDVAASTVGGVKGRSWAAGYSFRKQRWGFGVRQVRRDAGYADLAWPEPGTAPSRELQASLNLRVGSGSAALGGIHRLEADGRERSFARLTVGLPLMRGHLSLSALHALAPRQETSGAVTWTAPLDWGSFSAWMDADRRSLRPGVALQRNQPLGPGYGYHLALQDGGDGNRRASGDVHWRTRIADGSVTSFAEKAGSSIDARVGGALVWSANGLHATDALEGSYAVIKLPAPNVRVYRDNQVVATTGDDGTAIVTRLRPFETNRLSVAADDLPLDTQIQVANLEVVPGRRQVVRTDFGTSTLHSLALRVRTAEGHVPPPGSLAQLLPGERTVQVGHEGLLYLEFASRPESINIQWEDGARCTIAGPSLPEPQAAGEIADVLCQGVQE